MIKKFFVVALLVAVVGSAIAYTSLETHQDKQSDITSSVVATDRSNPAVCSATYQTVVFEYPKPVTDPIFNKLYDMTRFMEGSAPDDILSAAFGQDQYRALARDKAEIRADGKPNSHAASADPTWRFNYTTFVVNGQINTFMTGDELGAEKPRKLGAGWESLEGQSHMQTFGKPTSTYGFVSQLLRSSCI